jgi:plastocyanin
MHTGLSLLLVLAIVAAGCSGKGDPSPTDTSGPPSSTSSANVVTTAPSTTSSSPSTAPAAPAPTARAAKTFSKDITDNNFPDGTFTVQKGDTVHWTHQGTSLHSVSTTAGSAEAFDSSPNCPPACLVAMQAYDHTFSVLGNVTYHCKVHAGMTGTITVVAALAT